MQAAVVQRIGRRWAGTVMGLLTIAVLLYVASSLLAGIGADGAGGESSAGSGYGAGPHSGPGGEPWYGLLQVSSGDVDKISTAGLNRAVVGVSWSEYQPTAGTSDSGYVAGVAALIARLRGHGIGVVLDPGLQYPPDWVFQLPGATRFRNQYGVNWTGSAADGTAVANAVFNTAVRQAEAAYLHRLAADLGSTTFAAIRVGGLLTGELRYPPEDDGAGHEDSLWYFDSSAQANAPVGGWRPGHGTAAQASLSVHAYLDAITGYERWLLDTTAGDFTSGDLPVLLPGWGLRPGQVDAALGDSLNGASTGERGGMLASGESWQQQVALLANQSRAIAYTTWLDAAAGGTTPQLISPVEYLAQLGKEYRVLVAGENTGTPSVAALRLCLTRVESLGLRGMMWMSAPDLLAGRAGLTLSDYAGSIAEARESFREPPGPPPGMTPSGTASASPSSQ